jgi:hypothetical protein
MLSVLFCLILLLNIFNLCFSYHHLDIGTIERLLNIVSKELIKNEIAYYLDCGTLLGCIRSGLIKDNDTDLDISIHYSQWEDLKAIDFTSYGLVKMRTYEGYPTKAHGNMLSLKFQDPWIRLPDFIKKFKPVYCDVYAMPAFPKLTEKKLWNKPYMVPFQPELYLTQLYSSHWKIPSKKHASTSYHRNSGLVHSDYKRNWDKNYKIWETKF